MNLLLKKHISFHKQQFNTVSKVDSGEYSCEARNSVGYRRCPGKRMQVGKHEILEETNGLQLEHANIWGWEGARYRKGLSDMKYKPE